MVYAYIPKLPIPDKQSRGKLVGHLCKPEVFWNLSFTVTFEELCLTVISGRRTRCSCSEGRPSLSGRSPVIYSMLC